MNDVVRRLLAEIKHDAMHLYEKVYALERRLEGKPDPEPTAKPKPALPTPPVTTPEYTTCPKCGNNARLRKNQTTGSEFWGCKSYPTCRWTAPVKASKPPVNRDPHAQVEWDDSSADGDIQDYGEPS